MTQKDRQTHSRQKILTAAMEAFGAQDYDLVTMDSICTQGKISKGMMYHYYTGKEELFLCCLKTVFDALLEMLESQLQALSALPPDQALHEFFLIRERFFQAHPEQKNIFENALLRTPAGLEPHVQDLRAPIRALNRHFLGETLSRLHLRGTLTDEQAMRYFESLELFFWQLARQYQTEGPQAPMGLHELSRLADQMLDMILYGIAAPQA